MRATTLGIYSQAHIDFVLFPLIRTNSLSHWLDPNQKCPALHARSVQHLPQGADALGCSPRKCRNACASDIARAGGWATQRGTSTEPSEPSLHVIVCGTSHAPAQ